MTIMLTIAAILFVAKAYDKVDTFVANLGRVRTINIKLSI